MKKLLSAILAVSMLCLLVGCSQNTPVASSTPAPAASTSDPQTEPTQSEPDQSDASTSASASTPDASTSENLPDEKTAANQISKTGFLTGAFLNDAEQPEDNQNSEDELIYQIGCATIVSARFETRHGAEAFMDEYANGADISEPKDVTVAGRAGTQYHWAAGSNEDSSVTDAVVTEANGKSLLFLVTNSADAAAGYNDAGPVQEAVDSWMSSLMVAE